MRFTHMLSALATGVVLLGTLAPAAFADTTVGIVGNGFDSTNTVSVHSTSSNTLNQTNTARVANTVTTNLNTGNNRADNTTGGSVDLQSGNANTAVGITNEVNKNVAMGLSGCGCSNGTSSVWINGNGARSNNYASVTSSQRNAAYQSNNANVSNTVTTNQTTGNNTASGNTGSVRIWPFWWNSGNGQTMIQSGATQSSTWIQNALNSNQFGQE